MQLTLVGVGAALLLVFNLPGPVAGGIKSGVRELLAPYHSALASAGSWRSLRAQPLPDPQESLRTAELQRLETLESENDELRRLLGLEKRLLYRAVAARVMARDGASGWWRTARLNRGYQDGIGTNHVVISEKGVLGVVREVSPHTADVLLISDPGLRLSVRCNRTGDFGLLRGGGVLDRDGILEMLLPAEHGDMTFIPRDSAIREGDEIVTSGLGGVFPEGLRVGLVKQVTPAHSGLYLNARVAPSVDLGRLRHVLVLTATRQSGKAAP
jgi:rod shape-determining protein MreC